MNWVLTLAGVVLILTAMTDLVASILSTSGGGLLTRRIASLQWRVSLMAHRRIRNHHLLSLTAPLIVLGVLLFWVLVLWAGWTLIFSADPQAVLDGATKQPAELPDRIYFVGFTLFTLGLGDFVGGAQVWRVLTAVATLNGLFTVTLAITYLMPIVSASVAKRALALRIHSLGTSVAEIMQRSWDGKGFSGLEAPLAEVTGDLLIHSERHLAYPVLHYFHASERRSALGPAIVRLEDLRLLLSHGVDPSARPDRIVLSSLRVAVDVYLDRVAHSFVTQSESTPPHPDTSELRRAGMPLVSAEKIEELYRSRADRRRWIAGLAESDGWDLEPHSS